MKVAEFVSEQKKKRAAGCIFFSTKTKKFCLARRSVNEMSYPKHWSTWGGNCDPGETPEATVIREVAEEAGYTGAIDLVPMLTNIGNNSIYFNFLGVVTDEFEPKLNWENSDYVWVKFGKWPSSLHPGVVELLSDDDSVEIMKQYAKG